ncbi:hypothetical protein REPUB_Repub11eG0116000 [Reevesia pubescens]
MRSTDMLRIKISLLCCSDKLYSLLKIVVLLVSFKKLSLKKGGLVGVMVHFHEIFNLVCASVVCLLVMSEPPFRPREKLIELQKHFQSIHKHTYLKGRFDKITSVGIPAALAASSLFLIGQGIYNMSHGIGKKE